MDAPADDDWPLPRQVQRTAVSRPGVGVSAGRGEAGLTDRCLHQMSRRAPIQTPLTRLRMG
jgi:hypothetical protein